MKFCQINIDNLSLKESRNKVLDFLNFTSSHKVFTPNPEFIVAAQKDEKFKEVLNKGDLNICDGFGLGLFSGCPRIPGVDFMIEICKIAAEKNIGVYLLGSDSDEIVKKTAENLQKQIQNLKISGYDKGLMMEIISNPPSSQRDYGQAGIQYPISNYNKEENSSIIKKINDSGAKILFVAFGMNKQERWIDENLAQMPNIKIAMGVGGSFDYISGIVRRAPCFLRKIGLEWLYRLFKQPKRLGRISNAIIVFTYIVLKNKIFKKI